MQSIISQGLRIDSDIILDSIIKNKDIPNDQTNLIHQIENAELKQDYNKILQQKCKLELRVSELEQPYKLGIMKQAMVFDDAYQTSDVKYQEMEKELKAKQAEINRLIAMLNSKMS